MVSLKIQYPKVCESTSGFTSYVILPYRLDELAVFFWTKAELYKASIS